MTATSFHLRSIHYFSLYAKCLLKIQSLVKKKIVCETNRVFDAVKKGIMQGEEGGMTHGNDNRTGE